MKTPSSIVKLLAVNRSFCVLLKQVSDLTKEPTNVSKLQLQKKNARDLQSFSTSQQLLVSIGSFVTP